MDSILMLIDYKLPINEYLSEFKNGLTPDGRARVFKKKEEFSQDILRNPQNQKNIQKRN